MRRLLASWYAARKTQKIRQDDAAGSIGVSENFLGKIEHASESVQWGNLSVRDGLVVRVVADVPESDHLFERSSKQ